MHIHTHAEWHPLKEVVVGSAVGAQVPTVKDESLHAINYGDIPDEKFAQIKTGPFPKRIIEETVEDLDRFAESLTELGIKVYRPREVDFTEIYRTPDWAVDGYYAYCPRDAVLTVGEQAIETPMVLRHRQNEAERLLGHLLDGSVFRAPRPRLLDSMYDRSTLGVPTLRNDEPAFDAANCLKMGRDILFLISNTGNQAGADWLQEHLGPGYRVHPVRDVYAFIHIDSTFAPLRPGLVLLCPDRVKDDNLPPYFRNWDKIYAPEPTPVPAEEGWGGASKWISMNVLSLAPDLVAVEERQTPLIRLLEQHGIQAHPVPLRHTRTLGGGPHCVTLDLVRDGELEDYSL
jgi:N-dimethylarginine dimethylaminohydrolase